jgi:hypothetical protein
MLRVRPSLPVAQNGQPMPQPTCEEMHSVVRVGYRISTDSMREPSNSFHKVLMVVPSSATWRVTSVMSCRKISEFGGIHIEMAKVMVGELLDSELRQSEFGRFLDALLGRHIHKVQRRLTTAGMVLG